MKIKLVNKSSNEIPSYATKGSAGMDLRVDLMIYKDSNVDSYVFETKEGYKLVLLPHKVYLLPTGLYIELSDGYEAQIRPRSGLAAKHGITIINSPGTIDSDYRGEIKIIVMNLTDVPVPIMHGDRIAQMVINKYEKCKWKQVEELSDTKRGSGGFNSTGSK